jgi:hypothetical protein
MSQGVLGFKYEEEKHDTGMTGLAGLPLTLISLRLWIGWRRSMVAEKSLIDISRF